MRLLRRGESASTLDLLVAGLGNPGASTRRRVTTQAGWCSTSSPASRRLVGSKFSGQLAEIRLDGARLALVKPETYMNESGKSISAAARFFKSPVESVLVAHDDVDLEEGRLRRARAVGSPVTTACARSRRRSARRTSCACGSASAGPAAATTARSPTTCCAPFAPETDVDALVGRSADAVEAIVWDGSRPRSSGSTDRREFGALFSRLRHRSRSRIR